MNTLTGYSKSTLTDSYLLTAAGGHKAISDFVTLSGNLTISGVKTFSSLQKFTVADAAPFQVTSDNKVTNLNADCLDDYHETSFFRKRDMSASNVNFNDYFTNGVYINTTGNGTGNSNSPTTYGYLLAFLGGGSTSYYEGALIHIGTNGSLLTRAHWDYNWSTWKTILDSSNSSVSGGGSSGGSSITVKINGTSQTLTIPTSLPANGGSADKLNSANLKSTSGLHYYYAGGITTSTDNTGNYVGPTSSTVYSSILRLQSHITAGALYYRDLIFDVNGDSIWSRRVTNGGTPALVSILHSGNSSVSGGGSSWGSSITVKINGTEQTLTIPSNPDTWRPITDTYEGTSLSSTTSLSLKGANSLQKNVIAFKRAKVTNENYDANTLLEGVIYNYYSYSAWKNAPTGMLYGKILNLIDGTDKAISGLLAWDINHASTTDTTRYLWWRATDNGTFKNAKWHRLAYADEIPTIPSLSLGTTTGSGNAVTSISVDGHKITLNKGTTFSVSDHTHSHLVSGATLSGSDHALALKNYFTNNYSSIPRNSLNTYRSSAMSNTSQYFGYFIGGYNDTPYGGFYVAHYDTPYYVGISNGTFTQHLLAKITDITKSQVGLSNVQNTAFYKRTTKVNGTDWDMAGTVNGSAFTIYAPTTGGTAGYILKSNKDAAPTWIALSDISAGKLGGYEESKFVRSKGWASAGSINDFSQGIYGTDTRTTDVPKDANSNNLTYSTVLSFDALVGSGYGKVLFYVKSAALYYRHHWNSKWYDWYLIALKTKATSSALGLVKIGYTTSGKNYAVLLNSDGLMYVNVPWTDTQVTNTLATTTKFYLTGTNSSSTNTGTQYFDTNIYTDTEAGNLYALKMNAGSFRSSGHSILGYNSGSGWTGGENLSSVIVGTVGLPLVIRSSGNNLYHYHSANSTRYLICDTNNTSYTATLTNGTAIGTIKIGETSHTLYCPSRGYIGTTSVLASSAALKLKGINGLYLSEDSSSAFNNKGVNFYNSAGNIKHSIGATSNGFGIYSSGTLYLRAGCNASTSVDTALTSSNTGLVLDASGNLTVSGTISASNFSGVGNGKITIKLNNTEVGSFTMNQSSAGTINLTDTTYSLVGANGTTGLIKNGSTVTSATGYIACPIINGVPYYQNTTLGNSGVTAGTYTPTPSTVTNSTHQSIQVPELAINAQGLITKASLKTVPITGSFYIASNKTLANSDLSFITSIAIAPGYTVTLPTPSASNEGKIIFVKAAYGNSARYVSGKIAACNSICSTASTTTIDIGYYSHIFVCMDYGSGHAWVDYYCG